MANEISIYEPRYLAEVVRTTPLVRTFFLDNYFTNVKTFATKSVDIDVVKGDRRMASFVHPLVGGQVLKNEGYQTESFTPPLINPLTVTTANDALERMPGEDLYSGMTPEERAAKQLIEDYQRLNDAATRREEWMAVRTIMDGQIPIVGPGVNKVIDFGFTNKVTLEGTKKWGASAAKPLDDLEDWVDQVLENGFANVDHVVMGKTALRNFLADTNVQNMPCGCTARSAAPSTAAALWLLLRQSTTTACITTRPMPAHPMSAYPFPPPAWKMAPKS